MNIKQGIKIIVFMLIVGVIAYFLCDIFEQKNNYMAKGYASYKNCQEGTVDAVFIGTSGVNRSWIGIKAFDMYGLTVMPLSIDALPCWITLDMIKEAYRFQNPKLVILDMRMFTKYDPSEYPKLSTTRSRRAIDTLDFFSPNRLDAINRTLSVVSQFDDEISRFDPSLFFSFIAYHNMWSDDDFDPFEQIGSTPAKYMGYYVNGKNCIKKSKQPESKWSKKTLALTDIAAECLDEIIEYCDKKGIELLFVDTPHTLSKEESQRINEMKRILDEKKINYMVYSDKKWYLKDEDKNDPDLVRKRFDRNKHFYDRSHVNFDGAVIFTRLFAKYLNDNYDFTDHREDPRCPEWVGKYEKLKKKIDSFKKNKNA